jgi:hypothetical protein
LPRRKLAAKGPNVLLQEASAWFQVSGDTICASGLSHVPTVVWFVAVVTPIAYWLGEKTLATFWAEFVKHITRRANYLDTLAKTRAKLDATGVSLKALKVQLTYEQNICAKLFVENDRVLSQNLKLNGDVLRYKTEFAQRDTKIAKLQKVLGDSKDDA